MSKALNVVLLTAVFILNVLCLYSQSSQRVNYWVSFKNKNGSPFSLAKPTEFLNQKSLDRRTAQKLSLHYSDLPVTPSYVLAIDTIKHVNVILTSKWLNGVAIVIDSASVAANALNKIKSFSFVLDTGRVKKMKSIVEPLDVDPFWAAKNMEHSYTGENFNFGRSLNQSHQLDVDCLHSKGYRGQGMTIAVMDNGFTSVDSSPLFDSLRNSNGIAGTYDFVRGEKNVYQGGGHGTSVFSCLAANKPGVIIGTAPMARYWLFTTEDNSSETILEEYNWVRAAEFADSLGVDIITTSLGYAGFDYGIQNHDYTTLNGRTAPMSIAATMAARKGIFVLNAAGNEGDKAWKYVIVPADADSICSVGAVDSSGTYAPFSSQGPTADGRIKPDLMATGWNAWICAPSSVCFPGSGTSFATPIMAGAVACYWQQNRQLGNIELLNELKKRATKATSPDNRMGWGIPKLSDCTLKDVAFDYTVSYNSVKQQITFKLTQTHYDYVEINIYDLLGKKLISTGKIYGHIFTFPFYADDLANGVYITSVKTSKGSKTRKFMR